MIQIAVLDDELRDAEENERIIRCSLSAAGMSCHIMRYTKSGNLVADIVDDGIHYDIIVLDIEMPGITGMEVPNLIRPYLPNVRVILTTSHLEYVLDAFELSVFRYVPKTELDTRLASAVVDAAKLAALEDGGEYIISHAGRIEKIRHGDILYVQRGSGKNSAIHTKSGVSTVRKPLGQIHAELSSPEFIFSERGTIVNIIHVMKIERGTLQLANGEKLPVSRAHLSEVKRQICRFWGAVL